MMRGVSDVHVSKRERMARRADKWWRSVWHVQMLMTDSRMSGRDEPLSKAKPLSRANLLTDDVGRGFLKAHSTCCQSKHKPKVGRSDYTEGEQHGLPKRDVSHI
jgi:hypothetical protein